MFLLQEVSRKSLLWSPEVDIEPSRFLPEVSRICRLWSPEVDIEPSRLLPEVSRDAP
ncbi:hypothetical protein DPMN_188451 [Dreissena polymorpha]|uniref:Uncharacterized protein n=1 Tax=Dreissena polymorpha TaxID=45954 RepID=A0A9D4DQX1_DREPO|nr:hypothetical protein DPMN_188451 [Dreissena polymorpha]